MTRPTFSLARLLPVAALVALAVATANAQDANSRGAKKTLTVSDYTRWRTIDNSQISPDGHWVASTVRLTNLPANESKSELHLRNLDSDRDVVLAHASSPAFSSDSR